MKIALCLSGQPRFFERGYEYIKKNIIDPNKDMDIFIHLWFDESEIGNEGFKNTSDILIRDGYKGDFIMPNIVEKIKSLYNPKKIGYEKQYDCNVFIRRDYSSRGNMTNPFATFSQYYSAHQCVELKKEYENDTDSKYTTIIKCRFDIEIDRPIDISSYRLDVINFHNDVNSDKDLVFNDGFFFGDDKLMTNTLEKCYLNFDEYWVNEDIIWDNHYLIGKFIELNNIPYVKSNFGNIKWIRR